MADTGFEGQWATLLAPTQIRAVLQSRGIQLKKRWGQNFLVNRGACERIVDLLDPMPDETVWEIGPGLGALTELLLRRARAVVAFEIDRRLLEYLHSRYAGNPRIVIVQGDAVRKWQTVRDRGNLPADKVVGNLPFGSASSLVSSFVSENLTLGRAVFTMQRELADRMMARPRQKEYSSFSVFCQYAFNLIRRGELKPGSFFPSPRVISSIVELTPSSIRHEVHDRLAFFLLVRALFVSKRKTIRNNVLLSPALRVYNTEAVLASLEGEGISAKMRAEELSVHDFVRVANRLHTLKPQTQKHSG